MPASFSHIDLCFFTFPLLLLQLLRNYYCYFCHRYFHTTLLLNTLLQILSISGVVELTTQLLILENILWLPLCRINKFGLNTLPSKAVAIPYTCGLLVTTHYDRQARSRHLSCEFIKEGCRSTMVSGAIDYDDLPVEGEGMSNSSILTNNSPLSIPPTSKVASLTPSRMPRECPTIPLEGSQC